MSEPKNNLVIPYGVSDFKVMRNEGYMQAEFGHLRYYLARPEMELARGYCDFCLFPERVYNGDVRDSYIVELKYDWHGGGKWTFTNPIINVGAEFSLFDYTDRLVSMKSIVSW